VDDVEVENDAEEESHEGLRKKIHTEIEAYKKQAEQYDTHYVEADDDDYEDEDEDDDDEELSMVSNRIIIY
jgi:hypothetical protein